MKYIVNRQNCCPPKVGDTIVLIPVYDRGEDGYLAWFVLEPGDAEPSIIFERSVWTLDDEIKAKALAS